MCKLLLCEALFGYIMAESRVLMVQCLPGGAVLTYTTEKRSYSCAIHPFRAIIGSSSSSNHNNQTKSPNNLRLVGKAFINAT